MMRSDNMTAPWIGVAGWALLVINVLASFSQGVFTNEVVANSPHRSSTHIQSTRNWNRPGPFSEAHFKERCDHIHKMRPQVTVRKWLLGIKPTVVIGANGGDVTVDGSRFKDIRRVLALCHLAESVSRQGNDDVDGRPALAALIAAHSNDVGDISLGGRPSDGVSDGGLHSLDPGLTHSAGVQTLESSSGAPMKFQAGLPAPGPTSLPPPPPASSRSLYEYVPATVRGSREKRRTRLQSLEALFVRGAQRASGGYGKPGRWSDTYSPGGRGGGDWGSVRGRGDDGGMGGGGGGQVEDDPGLVWPAYMSLRDRIPLPKRRWGDTISACIQSKCSSLSGPTRVGCIVQRCQSKRGAR